MNVNNVPTSKDVHVSHSLEKLLILSSVQNGVSYKATEAHIVN